METIKFHVVNRLMYSYVPFWSKSDNKYLNAYVLIDTGATTTAFCESALKKLGCFDDTKKSTARTAGGEVDIHEVIVPKIMLGNMELHNIEVNSHKTLDDFLFDGILGMNILERFNFAVDNKKRIITFENIT